MPQIKNLVPCAVAHTRGKTVYKNIGEPVYVSGSSYTVKDIKEAMTLGAQCGESLFTKSSHFRNSFVVGVDSSSDTDESETTTDESATDTNEVEDERFRKQRIRKEAVVKFNGGRMSIPNKGRARKFFSQKFLHPHFFEAKCKCAIMLVKGAVVSGTFHIQKKIRGPWVERSGTGQILFLSRSMYESKSKSGGNSTVATEPAVKLCQKCDAMKLRLWVRIDGLIYLANKFECSRKRDRSA